MNAVDRRRLTPMLAVLAALLLVLLIVLWLGIGRGTHWHDAASPPRLPPVGATLPAPKVPPLEQFAEVWQHPLFSPTRSPEAASGGDSGSSGDLALTGVILLPGLKMAILHDKTTGKDYRVREGQSSNGAPALLTLNPRSAVVDASGSHLQLKLIPGPSPDAGNSTDDTPAPTGNAPAQAVPAQARVRQAGTPASASARARALKQQIEARRRRNRQNGGH